MPLEVHLTQIESKEVFEKAVSDHIVNLMAFRKVINKPRPSASPLVDLAVRRVPKGTGHPDDFVADYTFVDDLPKELEAAKQPEQPYVVTLEHKKQLLVRQVLDAESMAKGGIISPRKTRLLIHKNNTASLKPEDQRTEQDKQDIATWWSIVAKFNAIELIAAEAETAIDDLTDANIDNWQLPSFG